MTIVCDYDSLAAFRIQRQSILLDCQGEMQKFHKAFYDRNIPVDVIPAQAEEGVVRISWVAPQDLAPGHGAQGQTGQMCRSPLTFFFYACRI